MPNRILAAAFSYGLDKKLEVVGRQGAGPLL
jgi:hypothetical protein